MSQSMVILILLILINQISAKVGKGYYYMPELFYHDNYDHCMLGGDEPLYCYIKFILKPLNRNNISEVWKIIQNVSSVETNYRHDHLRHSICVPKTCPKVFKLDENDPLLKMAIEDCYNEKFRDLQLKGTVSEISCQTRDYKYPVDWLDILFGMALIIYILFVLYATYYDKVASSRSSGENGKLTINSRDKILSAFSLIRNWSRLKTVTSTPLLEKLRGIQGIRFYNSALVVLSHTILGFLALPVANTRFTETIHEKPLSIFFACGHLCMITFFFISSFLFANELFEYLKGKKMIHFKMALRIIVSRLFRQVPPLAFIVLFHATWLRHLGNGPHWDTFITSEYEFCRRNWWTNLLFINNVVNPDHMCLQTSWWLALNTQYFVLSLFFISLLKKYEKNFWIIIGVALSTSIFGTFLENYYYDFPSLLLYQPESWYDLKKLFASPQTKYQLRGFMGNLAGPICGIAFGYYFNKRMSESPNDKFFNSKLRVFFWWITIFSLGLGCVVVPGLVIFLYSNEHNAFWASVYMALSRSLFSVFLGVLIIGFTEEVGWIALKICRWPPTYILGRLTYSVYLIHMCIILAKPALSRFPVYMTEFIVFAEFFGNIVAVYIAATFLTLFVELPVSALQKLTLTAKEEKNEIKDNSPKNK